MGKTKCLKEGEETYGIVVFFCFFLNKEGRLFSIWKNSFCVILGWYVRCEGVLSLKTMVINEGLWVLVEKRVYDMNASRKENLHGYTSCTLRMTPPTEGTIVPWKINNPIARSTSLQYQTAGKGFLPNSSAFPVEDLKRKSKILKVKEMVNWNKRSINIKSTWKG